MVEGSHPQLSIVRQRALLQISRSSRYYQPVRRQIRPAHTLQDSGERHVGQRPVHSPARKHELRLTLRPHC